MTSPVELFDAIAAATIAGKGGASVALVAAREPSGKLALRLQDRDAHTLVEAGAQVAIGDLDLDGVPELVSTGDAGDDFIAVQSVTASDLRMRLRIPAPGNRQRRCMPASNNVCASFPSRPGF